MPADTHWATAPPEQAEATAATMANQFVDATNRE